MKSTKQFFYIDKTGRGVTNTFSLAELKAAFKGEKNWDGESAKSWAKSAEKGDKWENAASLITCIIYMAA